MIAYQVVLLSSLNFNLHSKLYMITWLFYKLLYICMYVCILLYHGSWVPPVSTYGFSKLMKAEKSKKIKLSMWPWYLSQFSHAVSLLSLDPLCTLTSPPQSLAYCLEKYQSPWRSSHILKGNKINSHSFWTVSVSSL